MKTKPCAHCQLDAKTLYRVQILSGKNWIFVCESCLGEAKLSPNYRYGGTWQGSRH
jgi:hypothetical protein